MLVRKLRVIDRWKTKGYQTKVYHQQLQHLPFLRKISPLSNKEVIINQVYISFCGGFTKRPDRVLY